MEPAPVVDEGRRLLLTPAVVAAAQRAAGNRATSVALQRDLQEPPNYLGTNIPVPTTDTPGKTVVDESVKADDVIASTNALRKTLAKGVKEDEAKIAELQKQLAPLENKAGQDPQTRAQLKADTQAQQLRDGIDYLTDRAGRRKGALDGLEQGPKSMQELGELATGADVMVAPKQRGVAGRDVTTEWKLDPKGPSYGRTTSTPTQGPAGATDRTTTLKVDPTTGVTYGSSTGTVTNDVDRGSSREVKRGRTGTADLSSASVTIDTSTKTVDPTGAVHKEGSKSTYGLKGDAGKLTRSKSTTTSTEDISDTGKVTKSSTTTTGSLSGVNDASGTGVGYERGKETKSVQGGSEVTKKVSGDGKLTVKVERSADPSKYLVTITVHGGLSGKVSKGTAQDEDNPQGTTKTLSGSLQGSADLVITRALTEAETSQLLGADVHSFESGTDTQGRPDLGIAARVKAMRLLPDEGGAANAVMSAAAAKNLREGEAVDLTLTAGADVGISVNDTRGEGGTKTTLGGELSGGGSVTRRVQVAKKNGKVVVTVTWLNEDHLSGGVSGGFGAASGNVKGSRSDSAGGARTFALDPDAPTYAEAFGAIRVAVTPAGVDGIAARYKLEGDRTETEGHKRGLDVGAGALGVGLGGSDKSETAYSVTKGTGKKLSGTMSGARTGGADLSIGGTKVVRGSQTNKGTGTVDDKGDLSLDFSKQDDETDAARSLADAKKKIASQKKEDTVADLATQGIGGYLKAMAEKTFSRLSGYSLTPADVDVMVARAGDTQNWSHGMASPRYLQAWASLRSSLVSPTPPKDWLDNDGSEGHKAANNLWRARAVADFMADAGDKGYSAVLYVLRHWGQSGFHEGGTEELGFHYEWPKNLDQTKAKYDAAKAAVGGLESKVEPMATGQGAGSGRAAIEDVGKSLQVVLDEIKAASSDFEEPRAQLEMIDNVQGMQRQVSTIRRHFETKVNRALSPAKPDQAGPPPPESEAEKAEDRRAVAEQKRQQLVGQLSTFKAQEQSHFAAARSFLDDEHGGTLRAHGFNIDFTKVDGGKAMDHVVAVKDLDKRWIIVIKQLRDVYRELGLPEGNWEVSTGQGAPRKTAKEPDVEAIIALHRNTGNTITYYWAAGNANELKANFEALRDY